MKRASIPGAMVGVWREGQPPYVRAFGVRDTASGAPMATDLYMRIGSATKAFVVTGILMLADQDKLGLDDPIGRYVEGVPSGDRIALRLLAQMRSGLYNYADDTNKDLPQQPFRKWTPRELVEVAFRHPIVFPPGIKFDYCNTNTVLLGLALEKVSGQSLASFIEQNILKPEGMTRTVFPEGAEIPSPHAQVAGQRQHHRRLDAGLAVARHHPVGRARRREIHATLGEYVRDWTAMARAGAVEARRLLREILVDRIVFRPVPQIGSTCERASSREIGASRKRPPGRASRG